VIQPYLCDCGDVINVAGIDPGTAFLCPICAEESKLDAEDVRLIKVSDRPGGVYESLLRERLENQTGLPAATPIEGTVVTTENNVKSSPSTPIDETIPIDIAESLPQREIQRVSTSDAPGPEVSQPAPKLAADGTLAPGSRVGVFRIDRILGRGGMGVVYEAFDTQLQRTAAFKVLGPEHVRDTEHVDRFRREARSAAALSHPNITHIYGMGVDLGVHWFAMELVRGHTLSQLLETDGPLSPELGLEFLYQVVQGLRAAHAKEIIHRDLKPTNLIVSEHGLVKITDFGLAKLITSSVEITATGIIMGTPLYMSPEQGRGENVDHRSDMYSLGCTFFHLISGSPPHSGETAMAVIVDHITGDSPRLKLKCEAGKRLAEIIGKMMEKSSNERFEDYDALLKAVSVARSATTTLTTAAPGRTILVSKHADAMQGLNPMSLKQISVADVNLSLGRHEKALGLYRRVLSEHPELEVELSFRMLKIYQDSAAEEEQDELCQRILELSDHPAERTYCRWKLLRRLQGRSTQAIHESRSALEALLQEELPQEFPKKNLEIRLTQIIELEEHLLEDAAGGLLLIRKSGDFQVELT